MKWTGMYLVGFALFVTGLGLALWKLGVLAMIGAFWTIVALVALLGIGIMIAVVNSTARRTIEIDHV